MSTAACIRFWRHILDRGGCIRAAAPSHNAPLGRNPLRPDRAARTRAFRRGPRLGFTEVGVADPDGALLAVRYEWFHVPWTELLGIEAHEMLRTNRSRTDTTDARSRTCSSHSAPRTPSDGASSTSSSRGWHPWRTIGFCPARRPVEDPHTRRPAGVPGCLPACLQVGVQGHLPPGPRAGGRSHSRCHSGPGSRWRFLLTGPGRITK